MAMFSLKLMASFLMFVVCLVIAAQFTLANKEEAGANVKIAKREAMPCPPRTRPRPGPRPRPRPGWPHGSSSELTDCFPKYKREVLLPREKRDDNKYGSEKENIGKREALPCTPWDGGITGLGPKCNPPIHVPYEVHHPREKRNKYGSSKENISVKDKEDKGKKGKREALPCPPG